VLPKGVVCDGCNNYFAKAVEKPFLESAGVKALRFHESLKSKKGRVPPIDGILAPGVKVRVTRHPRSDMTSIDVPEEAVRSLLQKSSGVLILPTEGPMPTGPVVSRFLAKIALESMAARLLGHPEGLAYLSDEPQLDAIRDHARRGRTPAWPVHIRRIYPSEASVPSEDGPQQVVHESDFLVTDANEWYFVLAVFGTEFAINIGGPHLDGYRRWLDENDGASILYSTKNLSLYPMPTIGSA